MAACTQRAGTITPVKSRVVRSSGTVVEVGVGLVVGTDVLVEGTMVGGVRVGVALGLGEVETPWLGGIKAGSGWEVWICPMGGVQALRSNGIKRIS